MVRKYFYFTWMIVLLSIGLSNLYAQNTSHGIRPATHSSSNAGSTVTYTNPIIPKYLADPYMIFVDGYYYLFATGSAEDGRFIPIHRSRDLAHWEFLRGAVSRSSRTDWNFMHFWAPEVYKIGNKYYLYYTASPEKSPANAGNHVGLAIADSIQGPYADAGRVVPHPSIDGHVLFDTDGSMYIFYTIEHGDENGLKAGQIYADRLVSPTQVAGKPLPIITSHSWQEGPFVLHRDGKYFLTYSCGSWGDSTYHIRYAISTTPLGPYTEMPDTILKSNRLVKGPGHHSLFVDQAGKDWIVYHGWDTAYTARYPRIDRIFISGNRISSNGPTFTAQPVSALSHIAIRWEKSVVIANMPVFKDSGEVKDAGTGFRRQGNYGSQYGRMLKLSNGVWLAGYTIARNNGYDRSPRGGLELQISSSDDRGRHWKAIAILSDPGRDLDNTQMIQLADGAILLACRSVRWQESYILPLYKSSDMGKSWTRIGVIDSTTGKPGSLGNPDKGIYEPHLYILDDGRLSVMYANEKHVTEAPSYSQIISQKVSPDNGRTWGNEIWVAYQPGDSASRPGMPVRTKMNDGRFVVVYEVCGPGRCAIHYKTSDDGVTWPVGLGEAIPDQLGGPYVLSLKDGHLILSSNSGNISVSDDYGLHWYKTFQAWPQTLWGALYITGDNEVGAVNSCARPEKGANIQLRFGKIF